MKRAELGIVTPINQQPGNICLTPDFLSRIWYFIATRFNAHLFTERPEVKSKPKLHRPQIEFHFEKQSAIFDVQVARVNEWDFCNCCNRNNKTNYECAIGIFLYNFLLFMEGSLQLFDQSVDFRFYPVHSVSSTLADVQGRCWRSMQAHVASNLFPIESIISGLSLCVFIKGH